MNDKRTGSEELKADTLINKAVLACMNNRFLVCLAVLSLLVWGILVAPFDWTPFGLPNNPVAVDAIPDIGENQQIVFSEWMGRSPQDVEDQITYPLTTALLGVPGVKTIRSISMFGFSSIYIIFDEDIEFYWSRSRVLEKLNSLPPETLPEGVRPSLGPDATGLGQIFWYTIEGRDPEGNPAGGWDLDELRSVQDWLVRYALRSAKGVSEVASIGGFQREYQVDVDPDAARAFDVSLQDIFNAVRMSNIDVGARTIEINKAEYVVRGLGFLKSVKDLEETVVKARDNVPIKVSDVATVSLGPAPRRGALDKAGAEAVGGVVVARYGANPLRVIKEVKKTIEEVEKGLPAKALVDFAKVSREDVATFAEDHDIEPWDGARLNQSSWLNWMHGTSPDDWPQWLTRSQLVIVPFYDRTGLIWETLGTLGEALRLEILVTVIVVLVMVMHLRSSVLISLSLPMAVLLCFIAMKLFGVDANIVALSGIAIAIGTMVDMGVVITENTLRHFRSSAPDVPRRKVLFEAVSEVSGAVTTAVATTIVGFLPVFTMTGAEGKLFKPLAFTKTFALLASVLVALFVIPPMAESFLGKSRRKPGRRSWWLNAVCVVVVVAVLTQQWLPLGPEAGVLVNLIFVFGIMGGLLAAVLLFQHYYARTLQWSLDHKAAFLCIPLLIVLAGAGAWLGADRIFSFLPEGIRNTPPFVRLSETFPGLGREFMPALDEGSFLYMPTTMPHASIGEALDVLQFQDTAIAAIPEVDTVVGKIGRVDSSLDPAPISMIETVINYKSEYGVDEDGNRVRQWRDHIKSPDDIWREITKAAEMPGTTSAPKLQPIETRLVMLQTGMRAPMGVKVSGPDLESIEKAASEIEHFLKEVPSVEPETVFADRVVGKPYIEIDIDRAAIARYGLSIGRVQEVIETAIGGRKVTTTVEGRERYAVRVRYQRELRDQLEALGGIIVTSPTGADIPLRQLADVLYVRGPQAIKSENTFLVAYVLFDRKPGFAEVDVVEDCQRYLEAKRASGELKLPPGIISTFTGTYENQIRARKTLMVVLPLALLVIFVILYLQFRSVMTTGLVFSGIFVAWAGGFILLWLYGRPWFLNVDIFGVDLRTLFDVHTVNLSVAVWVGFLALFGIASDNGVILATYLDQSFKKQAPTNVAEIRAAALEAGKRRIRPCLMTSATTILALLPVLTSTGRGSDVMVPMAIPSFGGMVASLFTVSMVPVLYAAVAEWRLKRKEGN